jgi:16S rRNA G966 N2-methylase RsmD
LRFTELLREDLQHYLLEHEHDDERELVLKHKTLYGVATSLLAEQLRGRKKAKEKLPLFYNTKNIIYPPQLNLEQSSSEVTAKFKSSLVSGQKLADLTGGFGVDAYFFSEKFDRVHYVEPDDQLCEIVEHNTKTLRATNITIHHQTAEEFLSALDRSDVVYIDPSRRKGSAKIVKLSDCSPDITALQSAILKKSLSLLVKTSPLIDLQQGLRELHNVSDVYIVSVNNECKEVLFLCGRMTTEPVIHTVNLLPRGDQQIFDFTFPQERLITSGFSEPKTYLYEPNASILKGGAFKSIAAPFSVTKISTNTHLYTSEQFVNDFPGRVFKVDALLKPDAASVALALPERKANILTRNYPLTPDQLKKKLKLTDGGDHYILAFSGQKEKYVVLAKRLK